MKVFHVDALPNWSLGVKVPGLIQGPFSRPAHRGRLGQLRDRWLPNARRTRAADPSLHMTCGSR